MKAFVSYNYGTDLSVVFDLLKSEDINFFDSMSDIVIGKSFQEAIISGIKECDIFVVIYESSNANVAFECGLALALRKPIFAIIATNEEDLPDFLFDSVHVFAK